MAVLCNVCFQVTVGNSMAIANNKNVVSPGMVEHICNPSTGVGGQEDEGFQVMLAT